MSTQPAVLNIAMSSLTFEEPFQPSAPPVTPRSPTATPSPPPSTQPPLPLASQPRPATQVDTTIDDHRKRSRAAAKASKALSRLALSTVTIFAWVTPSKPRPIEVQGLVVEGRFTVTEDILRRVRLDADNSFLYYRPGMASWVDVTAGHVVELSATLKVDNLLVVLLSSPDIAEWEGLDGLLQTHRTDPLAYPPRSLGSRRKQLQDQLNTIALDACRDLRAAVGPSRKRGRQPTTSLITPSPPRKHHKSRSSDSRAASVISISSSSPPSRSPSPYSTSSHSRPPSPRSHTPISISSGSDSDVAVKQEPSESSPLSTPMLSPMLSPDLRPFIPEINPHKWPQSYHAVDIAFFFQMVKNMKQSDTDLKNLFGDSFPAVDGFPRSNIYNHLDRWKRASEALRQEMLNAGRTEQGLWKVFMSKTKPKNADMNANKKWVQRRAKKCAE
ncbi:hypothetical protein AAF712_011413 [Marasmius tenuissimus]|uniref:Uncharacterized protein n=1 Tax=Marasmius tenuissimus TaxID=585030 RepID=A0ABR2ZJB9_9AGAR